MTRPPIIATWMYTPPVSDRSLHHQVGSAIGSAKVRNYYWRSAIVLLASAALHHPESKRLLLVNELPPTTIDGFKVAPILERFGIEVRELSQITRPPQDYHSAWNTQFIVLDALEELATMGQGEQPVLLLDSDCVFIRPLSSTIIQRISNARILRYDLGHADDVPENGLSNRDLAQLAKCYDPSLERKIIRYAGGEIFCARADILPEILEIGRRAFQESLRRDAAGLPKFNEEAHLLSYVYEALNSPDASANDIIKRIWTDRGVYSTVDGSEDQLTIWHLPAEKKTGIIRAFRSLALGNLFPLSIEQCEKLFHLKTSLPTVVVMHAKGIIRKIRNMVRNRTNRGTR